MPDNSGKPDHLNECVALLDVARLVIRDDSMPVSERANELHRLLGRIDGHLSAAELQAEFTDVTR
jgi:hypothetical protein